MNKDYYTCKCGQENKFSPHVLRHPINKIVQPCLKCARKNLIQNGKVIEYGEIPKGK